ncbi:MAG: hypothetical protein M3R72_12055 [Bacteroidota bacterium]|nr:hypothetical protein [Bacteroidota bacterium]
MIKKKIRFTGSNRYPKQCIDGYAGLAMTALTNLPNTCGRDTKTIEKKQVFNTCL